MKLYFQNCLNKERVIADVENETEAMKEVYKFLDAHHFKSYYTRRWVEPNGDIWFDVGSWSEFFIIREE